MDNDNIQFPLPVLYQNGCQSLAPLKNGLRPVAIVVGEFAFMDEASNKMLLSSARRHCKSLRFKSFCISMGSKRAWNALLERSLEDFNKTAALIGFKPIVFDAPYWFDQKERAEYSMGIVGFHRVRSMPSDTLLFYKVRPVIKLK